MKRKQLTATTILVATIMLASCGGEQHSENSIPPQDSTVAMEEPVAETEKQVKVDLETSFVHWKGEMLGMYSHEGNVKFKEANLTVKGSEIISGNFVVDMTTITPTDENYNEKEGKTPDKLVGHLSSPDFFDVANHPTASFEFKSIDGTTATGTLTIRGKSAEAKVENVSISIDGNNVTASGTLTFNRQNYGVSYKAAMKDMVLSDDITLNIEIKGQL